MEAVVSEDVRFSGQRVERVTGRIASSHAEIQRIVPDLGDVGSSVIRFADLELDGENKGAGDQDDIEATADAGHDELEDSVPSRPTRAGCRMAV